MIETFVALLTAHLASDFALQWDRMVANKRKPPVLLAHIAIVGLSAAIAIGARDALAAGAILAIIATHLLIDIWKMRAGDTLLTFTTDQLAHLIVIFVIALLMPELARRGLWSLMPGDDQAIYYTVLVYLSGLIAAVPLGGIVIKKLIAPLAPTGAKEEAATSPASTGRYIGWLERGLTFAFIVANQPEGVGFLLAAKSVLRIGDLKDHNDKTHAEYIIIGTFLSFGWAIVVTFATAAAAAHWSAFQ